MFGQLKIAIEMLIWHGGRYINVDLFSRERGDGGCSGGLCLSRN